MINEIIKPIDDEKVLEELICPICLCIFDNPILELPNQHIFCEKCLDSYLEKNNIKEFPKCPICKELITSTIQPKILNNILSALQMKCSEKYENEECDFKGNVIEYYAHIKKCELLIKSNKDKLEKISENMKDILDKEINPHLKQEHLEIFEKYVDNWNWLVDTNKDWKWWWWSNNEWWENKPCIECNNLWHKYEDEIQVFENQRISILKTMT